MFLGERKAIIQSFILTDDPAVREKALGDLLAVQTEDFYGMFKAMDGLPVVVRLLDPPLHEFLDDPRSLEVEITRLELTTENADLISTKRKLLSRIDSMVEMNPMLGLRGVRLAILNPELAAMQVRAIATAAARLFAEGLTPEPEIMIPLVSVTPELETLRTETEAVLAEVAEEYGIAAVRDLPIGTMIELPRAAVTADDIARYANFFSFGTNDLTQTAFGFSRDDVESKFIPRYLERKLIPCNPFETIDPGVAKLVEMACELGRKGNPAITLGVCGEHGGDPESVKIFHTVGLDYVSCSPYRVPLARLAAGQAALAESFATSDNR
jgi:pyruvate,orthophosphate dikinase